MHKRALQQRRRFLRTWSHRELARLNLIVEGSSGYREEATDQPKQDLGEIVSDLVVSGATLLAHSAAETVVKRVKKAAAKLAPIEAVKKVPKKAKKSAAGTKVAKAKKAKKASKKSGPKKSAGKAAKKSSKKTTRKKSKR